MNEECPVCHVTAVYFDTIKRVKMCHACGAIVNGSYTPAEEK